MCVVRIVKEPGLQCKPRRHIYIRRPLVGHQAVEQCLPSSAALQPCSLSILQSCSLASFPSLHSYSLEAVTPVASQIFPFLSNPKI